MKKMISILLIFALVLLAASSCSSAGGDTAAPQTTNSAADYGRAMGGAAPDGAYDKALSDYDGEIHEAETAIPPENGNSSSIPGEQRKRIMSASLSMQTTEFDKAYEALEALVAQYDGYFEYMELYNGSGYDGMKMRTISSSIRIPVSSYNTFLQTAGNIAAVKNLTKSEQDVSEQYFDLESRLKTLLVQQERYIAILEKADSMETIVAIEEALSNVQYEIERYTGQIKKLDALIDYATISLSLQETYQIIEDGDMPSGFFERLSSELSRSMRGAGMSFENALISFVAGVPYFIVNLPWIILWGLIFYVAYRILKKRGIFWRKKEKTIQTGKEENKE